MFLLDLLRFKSIKVIDCEGKILFEPSLLSVFYLLSYNNLSLIIYFDIFVSMKLIILFIFCFTLSQLSFSQTLKKD